jgi:hypothetical protein
VSTPEDNDQTAAGGSPTEKKSNKKEKLIRLDDLIPKKNVSGGRQLLFGATEIKPMTNKPKRPK